MPTAAYTRPCRRCHCITHVPNSLSLALISSRTAKARVVSIQRNHACSIIRTTASSTSYLKRSRTPRILRPVATTSSKTAGPRRKPARRSASALCRAKNSFPRTALYCRTRLADSFCPPWFFCFLHATVASAFALLIGARPLLAATAFSSHAGIPRSLWRSGLQHPIEAVPLHTPSSAQEAIEQAAEQGGDTKSARQVEIYECDRRRRYKRPRLFACGGTFAAA